MSKLKETLDRFLSYCYYRPLVIGIFNNGSTDDTKQWLYQLQASDPPYGVTYKIEQSDVDLGCAEGTNRACGLVRACEFAIHLESDFYPLSNEQSGEDKLWLRRAIEFMQTVDCNYLYLRRMVGEWEMMAHYWSQWMPRITEQRGKYLNCPDFWWSNNPAIRRNEALYKNGTLPLDVTKDGPKGTPAWSQPELTTKAPGRTWIHQWGLFIHDRELHGDIFDRLTCKKIGKQCKYGFFKDGSKEDPFCELCANTEGGYREMPEHEVCFRDSLRGK